MFKKFDSPALYIYLYIRDITLEYLCILCLAGYKKLRRRGKSRRAGVTNVAGNTKTSAAIQVCGVTSRRGRGHGGREGGV